MGEISTEQKLRLVQMIRAESQNNRMKMRSREKMLYGADSKFEYDTQLYKQKEQELPVYAKEYTKELYAPEEKPAEMSGMGFSAFKLRMLIAVLGFAAFFVLDVKNEDQWGISAARIREEINKDFDTGLEEVVFDFENNFPYTLFMNRK